MNERELLEQAHLSATKVRIITRQLKTGKVNRGRRKRLLSQASAEASKIAYSFAMIAYDDLIEAQANLKVLDDAK